MAGVYSARPQMEEAGTRARASSRPEDEFAAPRGIGYRGPVFELILNPGRPDEQRHPLRDGVCTLGRAEDCTLPLASGSVSRNHARIEVRGDRAWVSDNGSKNGTFVNEARVERAHALQPGDRLRIGEVVFRLVLAAPSAPVLAAGVRPTAVRREPSQLTSMALDLPRPASPSSSGLESMATLKGVKLPSPVAARSAEEKLRLLLRVSQILAAPAAAETIAGRILELASELLEAHRGAVLLYDPRTHDLTPAALRSDVQTERPAGTESEGDATTGDAGDSVGESAPLPYSRRIVDWVREQRAAGLFSNTLIDFRLVGSQSVRAAAICSAMAAPLLFDDELLGVIYVDTRVAPDRYDEGDLDFLSAFANLAAAALENTRLRERLETEAVTRNNLMRFFPPTTVRKLQAGSVSLRDVFAVADTEITALFADITGFTELSTRMEPRELVALLNAYFPPMAEIVFRHDGTLEKYIGDALLAVWGAPLRQSGDADRALAAAMEMQRALATLALPVPLKIHIGLHTGPVAAGNIGSSDYVQYATIGEATNLAARICGVAESGEIVLSETTRQQLTSPVDLVSLGPITLKGRATPLVLHRVVLDAG